MLLGLLGCGCLYGRMNQQKWGLGGGGGGEIGWGRRAHSPAPLMSTLASHTPFASGPSLQPTVGNASTTLFCYFTVPDCTLLTRLAAY